MAVSQEIRDALNAKNLDLPPEPKILAIDVAETVDEEGDEALLIFVTIDEDTDVEKLSGEAILRFKRVLRDSVRSRGVTLFPYVHVAKPSELKAEQSEGRNSA